MGQPPSAPCVHFCFFAPFRASSAEAKVGRNGRNRLSKCIFARTNRQKRKILLQKMTDYNKYTNFCERLSQGMALKRGFPQIHADCFFSPQITRIISIDYPLTIYNRKGHYCKFFITHGLAVVQIGYDQLVRLFRQQRVIFNEPDRIMDSSICKEMKKTVMYIAHNRISRYLIDKFQRKRIHHSAKKFSASLPVRFL